MSTVVWFTDAQKEGEVIDQHSTIILRRSSIWEYAFWARDVVGEFVRVLVEGEGDRSSLGCVVSLNSLVWRHAVPALGAGRLQDEVVTGLTYLEITSADSILG